MRADRTRRQARLVSAALDGRAEIAERLLAEDPGLAAAGLDVALVLGDVEAVSRALAGDPQLVSRELPGPQRRPLSCACFSVFLRPSSPRAPGVREVIRLLLDHGADVDEKHRNEYGAMSVLYGAAGVAHDPQTTRLLLERGADPDDGESVYHAVGSEDTTCLELLLAAGATVRGTNALANAIDSPVTVRVLLEQGDLRAGDPELRDSLLRARNPEVAALLIAHGAALDARDGAGRTPYSLAAKFKSPAMMTLLAAAGASTEVDPATEWIGAIVRGEPDHAARVRAEHPELALTAADAEELPRWASAGDNEVVRRLLEAGVPLDARGVDDGTALHHAGLWGMGDTVKLLLARGAEVDLIGGPREHPGTALAWTAFGSRQVTGAAQRLDGYLNAAKALLDAGARVAEGMAEMAAEELAVMLEQAAERDGILRDTGLFYVPGRPVRVSVRRRGNRYDLDDMGAAVTLAGQPPGWLAVAQRTVQDLGWNINRTGVVCMQAIEGRDVKTLIQRTGEASAAVYEALLTLQE